jgi:type VI secretion system protein ImpL
MVSSLAAGAAAAGLASSFLPQAIKEAATSEQKNNDWVLQTSTKDDLTLEGSGGPFKTTAIVWGDDSPEGREAVQRVLTRGVPFAKGGEVTSKPDDIKNLLSFLDK